MARNRGGLNLVTQPGAYIQPIVANPTPLQPVVEPEQVRGPTKRQVVRVLSNQDGVMTFDGGMQIVSGDQPYDEGDRILLINGQPAGRMQQEDTIKKVYL